MRRFVALVLLALLLTGCPPPGAEWKDGRWVTQGAPRAKTADDIEAEYKAKLDARHRAFEEEFVWVTCKGPHPFQGKACGLIISEMLTPQKIDTFIRKICHEDPAKPASKECIEMFVESGKERQTLRYNRMSRERFVARCAEPDDPCATAVGTELVMLDLHNQAALDSLKRDGDAIVEQHAAEQRRHARARADAERQEREDEERRRRTAAAVAAGLKGLADGFQASANAYKPSSDCTNDFQCGLGKQCVRGGCIRR